MKKLILGISLIILSIVLYIYLKITLANKKQLTLINSVVVY